MSVQKTRLDRLNPDLTAKERAILVLKAWKQGKTEDPGVRLTMPQEQCEEFNRYINLMNGVNQRLGPFLLLILPETQKLDLRLAGLITLVLWGLHASKLAWLVPLCSKEPVTESEHRALVKKARAEYKPVSELAEVLVERHEDWAKKDLEQDPIHNDEVIVTDAAWARVGKEKERELAGLVEKGKLKGRKNGRRLVINAGSFYDRLKEQPHVWPEWGLEHEVFPDDMADHVRDLRRARADVREVLNEMPGSPVPAGEEVQPVVAEREPSKMDELAELHKRLLVEGVHRQWANLRASEVALAEVAEQFDREDPTLPDLRQLFEHNREKLEELHAEVRKYVGPFDLPEPDEELLATVRGLVEGRVDHYQMGDL